MKCDKVKIPCQLQEVPLKPGGRGPCLPAVGYFIPELNLNLARNRCQRETQTRYSSHGQKEQDKYG